MRNLILIALCFSTTLGYSQASIEGKVYSPLGSLQPCTTYLYDNISGNTPIDSTNKNPFQFIVQDTSRQYSVACKATKSQGANFSLYNLTYETAHILGLVNNKHLRTYLAFDGTKDGSVDVNDLLYHIKLSAISCGIEPENLRGQRFFPIDSGFFEREFNLKADSIATLFKSQKLRYDIQPFANQVSKNFYYLASDGIFDPEGKDIGHNDDLKQNIYFPNAHVRKGEYVNTAVILGGKETLISMKLEFELKHAQNLTVVPYGEIIPFVLESDEVSGYHNLLFQKIGRYNSPFKQTKIEFNFIAQEDGELSDFIGIRSCEDAYEGLHSVNNQWFLSKSFNLLLDSTLTQTRTCQLAWPADTILASCIQLTEYDPTDQFCTSIFSYYFNDQITRDSLGNCEIAHRFWYRTNLKTRETESHLQIIRFEGFYENFCVPEIVYNLEDRDGAIGIESLISFGDAAGYSFDQTMAISEIKPNISFDEVREIYSYRLQDKAYCISKISLQKCNALNKLAFYKKLDFTLPVGGPVFIKATDFDQNSFNDCDPISKIGIRKPGQKLFEKQISHVGIANQNVPLELNYELASGKSVTVAVTATMQKVQVNELIFESFDDELTANTAYRIWFTSPNFNDVFGIQFQLHLANAAFLGDTVISWPKNEFGSNFFFNTNDYRFLWIQRGLGPIDYSHKHLFALDIKPHRNCRVSDIFSVNVDDFEAFAINSGFGVVPIKLKFVFNKRTTTGIRDLKPTEIQAFYDKSASEIKFFADLTENARVRIFNSTGTLVHEVKYSQSYEQGVCPVSQILPSGIYFLQVLDTENRIFTSKIISI